MSTESLVKDQDSYRQIVKATSIFGGVQAFQIVLSIVRSKFVAVLLGPTGMGIAGLLTSTTALVSSITNFGLGTSAIKNISEASKTNDNDRIAVVVGVFRRLVWITGILGSVIVILFSGQLSDLTFGNREYSTAFVLISITLLFNQLTSGQLVVLQGMRRLNLLAKAGLVGSIIGVLVSVPLYYFFGIKGIVPAIILTSLFSLGSAVFFSRKIQIRKISIPLSSIVTEGKGMVTLGFLISLTGLLDQLMAYITRIYISNQGSVADVGLYNAGFSMVNIYVGMIFTAMLTDYYPRLSQVSNDNLKSRELINQQAETALLILTPIIMVFFVFSEIAIVILFSKKFLDITDMVVWAAFGIFFKVPNWAMGIILLAKGESKLYFITYILAALIVLATNIGGYYYFGLTGLGIGFLVSFIILTIIGYAIIHYKYSFTFSREFIKVFLVQFVIVGSCFMIVIILSEAYQYYLGIPLMILSIIFSYKELDKRVDIRSLMSSLLHRFKRS